MPRPQHPPTPASSTEIRSKDGTQYSSLQLSFELPPPAVNGADPQPTSSPSSNSSSASSYHPEPTSLVSPAIPASEVVKTRRRSSVAQKPNQDTFALPPPPTRSRKIIQMKPKGSLTDVAEAPKEVEETKDTAIKATPAAKKKQPSSTSVAGRKIARKTAHSLIERRRRSKMNEEFGVLKDMIPACTGEMHKLAILQASIDYVRYLEDCVTKLKAENNRTIKTPINERFVLPPPARADSQSTPRPYADSHEEDEDVEMGNSAAVSPDSYSSVSTDQRHYSFSASSTTSPALGPGAYEFSRNLPSVGSALTSPALLPQRDLDQEATAALLMLNTDRRGTRGSISGRGGMSVKDLLST
ncbi:HLH, helix-loop-helix DNA-binding protein [Glarea lozoyensis ATCC 20868]|uniref:HLH, helix-loop-helix DNA-binding protein n=1 Tax=Glarea lozoyensis (strain ATCC 20868 / MF5171) TaxID=1116229 RepID=S3DHP8_GLAL2|nr:HLH, helix-loop-helix DNA-binding protein [Glarea lozoyensis ATCC 20868]EPE36669.1 HLH, helix-loop-helix DNA-binding protein [Glarea lozoyensis ATCC 20868]